MLLLRPSLWRNDEFGAASIREVVFGVEDGVVQNMTLVAGMVGAGLSHTVILFAGAVNAVAGVLSMSMGTYLSSKAEEDVARARATEAVPPQDSEVVGGPLGDAFVMAMSYAVGAAMPLLAFAFGTLTAGVALLLAAALTGITLFALGYGKALLSNQHRIRSGLEMLALASAAGLAGYLVGVVARNVFGLEF